MSDPETSTNTKTETIEPNLRYLNPAQHTHHCCHQTVNMTEKSSLPNFFGRIRERNLTLCIDTSGSMYLSLGAIKEHVCEFLTNLASHPLPTAFNLVEFSTEVTQWSDRLVTCTPQTVAVANDWIKGLEAKTGTNTLDALMTALGDDRCDAVVLVTDGMPDQNPADILDQVALMANNRPVHCYYIRNGVDPDDLAMEFLQDLAMETYGSFHVVTVAQHGAIERVTPVYRAEATHERIIRTTEGTIYPSNHKECTVATTLDAPVDYLIEKVGPDYIVETDGSVQPTGFAHLPYWDSRYYCSYYYPYAGWSRYRPAKSWPKSADKIIDLATSTKLPPHVSPGPGALVIGTKVLARRHEDGYFYKGKVKSEIFERKFLVEFGPCKHGKYRETSYQETFIYDIISLDDALRHSVLVGDKVLAPWEPDSERYAPATVIDGQERRSSGLGAGEDVDVVVSLDHDGKSRRLDRSVGVWIPPPLHERITFELKLPPRVRKEIATTEDYPLHSLPGYPRSGLEPYPKDYDRFEEVVVERADGEQLEKGLYRAPYFVPLYPVHFKTKPAVASVKSEVVEQLIPGTGFTKEQLNEKVLSQIMEHKMLLEEIKRDQAELREKILVDGGKLLSRRDNVGENTLSSTKKSVTFDEDTKTEAETRDSGHGSVTDILSDLDLSDLEWDESATQDVASGTDAETFTCSRRRRRTRRAGKLPPWKYWKPEPAPSLLESNNFGRYRVGPFRDCLMAAPLEAKQSQYGPYGEGAVESNVKEVHFSFDQGQQGSGRCVPSVTDLTPSVLRRIDNDKKGKHIVIDVEWTDPMSRLVNAPPAGPAERVTVRDSMGYLPRPPPPRAEKQAAGVDISLSVGGKDAKRQDQVNAGRAVRRQRIIERERTWETRRVEKESGSEQMRDQHRQKVLNQVRQDWQRVKDDQDRLAATRDAKRALSSEMRTQHNERAVREAGREDRRIEALRARREQLQANKQETEHRQADTEIRRQALREKNQLRYWASVNSQRLENERQTEGQEAAKRAAHAQRIQHFRDLETQGQAKKVLQNQVNEQRNAMMRSSIFT